MTFEVWESFPLRVAYSIPADASESRRYPILCFLHGDQECEVGAGKGKDMRAAMSVHGPLGETAAPAARTNFIVVCPQLRYPGGNAWGAQLGTVRAIVDEVRRRHFGHPTHAYLTGFSYGGNGVFALAEALPWTALWIVDSPGPVGNPRPTAPTWISAGPRARENGSQSTYQDYSRREARAVATHVYDDIEGTHGQASLTAYGDGEIYEWLRAREGMIQA